MQPQQTLPNGTPNNDAATKSALETKPQNSTNTLALGSHGHNNLPLKKQRNKKLQIILLVVFVLLIVAVGVYFVFFSKAGTAMTGSNGEFTALTPARILDTRSSSNVGGVGTIGAQATKTVKVLGQGGVPNSGVKAVVMNVTVANPTAASYVTVWQSGTSRPLASSLNFVAGQVLSNQATVPVASDGTVQVYNNTGNVDVIFDVVGYFATTEGNPGSRYVAVNPDRIVDTRGAIGSTTLTPSQTTNIQITGNGSVPGAGVRAVVMNVTVVNPTAAGYLTIWPAGTTKPTVSSINFSANQVLSNQVTVPVGAEGKVTMFNYSGNTNVIYDVVGYYEDVAPGYDQTQAGRYDSVTPGRILDTRSTSGSKSTGTNGTIGGLGTLGPDKTVQVQISGKGGIPSSDVRAVTMNVTVVNPSAPGFLTVWPGGLDRPGASSINFAAGQTLSNQITVPVSEDGKVQLYNLAGNTNVIFDVLGYYVDYPASINVQQFASVGTWLNCSSIEYNDCKTKVLSSNVSYQSAGSYTRLGYGTSVYWTPNDNPLNGYGHAYKSYEIDFLNSKVSIDCSANSDVYIRDSAGNIISYQSSCVSLSPTSSIDSYAWSNGDIRKTYNYDLPVRAANFKIITSVVTNVDNAPGTWVKYSMANPDSPAVDLLRFKIADTNLNTPNISNLDINVNSNAKCSSTSGDSLKVFNIMSNGRLVPITDTYTTGDTSNVVGIWNSSTAACPGVSKTQLAKGSDIYEGYTDWGMVFKNNIPKDQRDATKPVISDTQAVNFYGYGTINYWDTVTQTTSSSFINSNTYLASAKASDDNIVTGFTGYVDKTDIHLWYTVCLDNATIDYIKATKGKTLPSCDQVWRYQGKVLYDVFNITSIPYAPIRLEARDNSGNESTLMYTPKY